MRSFPACLALLALLSLAPAGAAQHAAPGALFAEVAEVLLDDFHDRAFRARELPPLIDEYRPHAEAASTPAEERAVITRFLSRIPASHLALVSKHTHESLGKELGNRTQLMTGFQVIQLGDDWFAHFVLEGGPAERAGIREGDRIVSLDGVPTGRSPLVDWPSDDAWLDDPPICLVMHAGEKAIEVVLERTPDSYRRTRVMPAQYSAWEAAKASVREIVSADGKRYGYVHFWYIHLDGCDDLLRELAKDEFADCDALLLDLRGRGGSGGAVYQILRVFEGRRAAWKKPVVALVDRLSRSAKEVLAHEFQEREIATVVGETTAGAVIPATFRDVGGAVLMFPSFTLPGHTELLEGKGVVPDVEIAFRRAFLAGADPILEAGMLRLDEELSAAAAP